MPRGGRRQGTPGARYAQRTDLAQGPRKLPVSVAPNQPYGEAGAQAQAQQAVPMASGPLGSGQTATDTQPQMTHADVMQAAQGYNPPPVIPLSMPTLRPDEHVMTGVNPGAPALAAVTPPPVLRGLSLLNALGENAPPEVQALRRVVAAGQANAATP